MIGGLPYLTGLQDAAERVDIDAFEILRNRIKQIEPQDGVTGEARRSIRYGKIIPRGIAVEDSELRIEDIADGGTSLQRVHDPGKVIVHAFGCAEKRYDRRGKHFLWKTPQTSVMSVTTCLPQF